MDSLVAGFDVLSSPSGGRGAPGMSAGLGGFAVLSGLWYWLFDG
jgi:hypothetical protein